MNIENLLFVVLFGACFANSDENCDKNGHCEKNEATVSSMFSGNNLKKELHQFLLKDDEIPFILWWDDHLYPHQGKNTVTCELGTCAVSDKRSVIQHQSVRMIIFSTTHFEASNIPLPRQPYHLWALVHGESPKNNWMMSTNIGISLFNYTATFRRESDYPLSTQFLKYPPDMYSDDFFVPTDEKNRYQKEDGLAAVVYVQRDCNPPSDRDTYVTELMKYIKIDSYGPCLNNKKLPENIDGFHHLSDKAYYKFLARYKFQLAFENAICQDYMTEKIFRPMHIGSVPVYLGSPNITDFMPSLKSVIKVIDFTSAEALAKYLHELNSNDEKYDEYLKHRREKKFTNEKLFGAIKRQPWTGATEYNKMNFGYYMFSEYSCFLCNRIHERISRIKDYLRNGNDTLVRPKFASYNHMGCPLPKSSLTGEERVYGSIDKYLRIDEAKAIVRMIHAGETDSKKWKDYVVPDERHQRKFNGFYAW